MSLPAKTSVFFAAYKHDPIDELDYAEAAATLRCRVAAIKAVASVESPVGQFINDPNGSFDPLNRCLILYERHVFARCTEQKGKFDVAHPDLSGFGKPYGPGGYGTYAMQYDKLERAYALDKEPALKACSWGKFQILGENYASCGFGDVASFVTKSCRSEDAQLAIFTAFISRNPTLSKAIRNEDWEVFARVYNGPQYRDFKYDVKLATAFQSLSHA